MTSLAEFNFKHQLSSSELEIGALLGGISEFPTPPLSPDQHDDPSSSASQPTSPLHVSNGIDHLSDLAISDVIMQQIMSTSEVFMGNSESSDVVDLDPSILTFPGDPHALLQDCMWNSDSYEPRHSISGGIGLYTPAPSPPSQLKECNEEDEDEEETVSEASQQGECISPSEVFTSVPANPRCCPHLYKQERQRLGHSDRKGRRLSTGSERCAGRSRVQPRSLPSESEEEIDVVTISDKPAARKQGLSVSTPCSRQTSPAITECSMSPTKKQSYPSLTSICSQPAPKRRLPSPTRTSSVSSLPPAKRSRYHARRMHRPSSTGSSIGEEVESDEEQRRASHNILERKRRNDLKDSYQELRRHIPELENNSRAPKVTILRKAAEHIKDVQVQQEDQQCRLDKMLERRTMLQQRLAYLSALC